MPSYGRLSFAHLFTLIGGFCLSISPSIAQEVSFGQLGWVERAQLPLDIQQTLPEFCSGSYVLNEIESRDDEAMQVQSNKADFVEQQGAIFTGDVQLIQKGQQVNAQYLQYNQDTGDARFKDSVVFKSSNANMAAKSLHYNTQTGQATLNGATYVFPESHMRGEAQRLEMDGTSNKESATLYDASYTFCEPGHNDWDIKASEIHLNPAEHYGEAFHGRLRIAEIPVLYLPYFRFPMSENRLTGFLNPEISLSTAGTDAANLEIRVNQFATPFYINIAPNYDDTITPRFLDGHGILLENEFRYLNVLGEGELSASYLGNDEANDKTGTEQRDKERWSQTLKHSKRFAQHWSHTIDYSKVSDEDYEDDFSRTGFINRTSHLKQNTEVNFNNGQWQFLTRAESYQTIDENIADANKPFHRLPQVLLKRLSDNQYNQFNYELSLDATRFTRDHENLTGVSNMDGERAHTGLTLSYPLYVTYGFLKPKLEMSHTQYSFQNLDSTAVTNGYKDEVSRSIYTASVDAGLFFDRDVNLFGQGFIQTLEPRIMLAYTPFEDQSQIPIFDTTQTSFSYSQIFNANRFTGLDRIGDTQQISLGLTSRFLNELGQEVFRASIGQIHYLDDQQVLLAPGSSNTAETEDSSSLAGEIEWQVTEYLRSKLDIQYKTDAEADEEPVEKASAQIAYKNPDDIIFNMNFSHVEASRQKQVGIGFFAPVNDRWAFFGQKKHDIYPYSDADKQVKEDENLLNIEGILGFEYQNCCWRAQVTYEEHTLSDSTKDYQLMLQVHLKGLGILGGNSDDILRERIYGYEQRQIHDY
jgi:LPS-assembly protein